ncbi:MAG: LysR family transcriptional regulator [Gammaproteobacteria bacterium]|nr:LysR family transcriptional regulator [Gammaproteobacteria bacterium]
MLPPIIPGTAARAHANVQQGNFSTVELYHLRTFVMVANEGNLTRAAERLYTSQPAVSAHVKALERELEVTLFRRTPKGMQLTPGGRILREKAKRVLGAAGDLVAEAKSMRGKVVGISRIGVNTDGDFLRLSLFLTSLSSHHPHLALQFIQDVSGNILEDILHGTLDSGFFFGRFPEEEIEAMDLAEIGFVIAGPATWKDRVVGADWETVASLPWVFPVSENPYSQIFDQLFSEQVNQPNRVAYSSSEAAINALVKAGAGLSLIREDEAIAMQERGEVVIWNHTSYPMTLRFGYLSSRSREPLIMALRQGAQESWPRAAGRNAHQAC